MGIGKKILFKYENYVYKKAKRGLWFILAFGIISLFVFFANVKMSALFLIAIYPVSYMPLLYFILRELQLLFLYKDVVIIDGVLEITAITRKRTFVISEIEQLSVSVERGGHSFSILITTNRFYNIWGVMYTRSNLETLKALILQCKYSNTSIEELEKKVKKSAGSLDNTFF